MTDTTLIVEAAPGQTSISIVPSRGTRWLKGPAGLPRPPAGYRTFEEVLAFARRQTWVLPDGEKDRRLVALLYERAIETDEGWTLPAPRCAWASCAGRRPAKTVDAATA